jgi:hypothetical protein
MDAMIMASQLMMAGKVAKDHIRIFSKHTYSKLHDFYPLYLNDLMDYDQLHVPILQFVSEHIDIQFEQYFLLLSLKSLQY